jgi:hypothetical protein
LISPLHVGYCLLLSILYKQCLKRYYIAGNNLGNEMQPATSQQIVARKQQARSKSTNRSSWLRGVDGRSIGARRYRDLVESFSADLGAEKTGEFERAQIRQAAALVVRAEILQSDLLNGLPVNDEQIVRISNVSTRILSRLGIRKRKEAPKVSLRERLLARERNNAA